MTAALAPQIETEPEPDWPPAPPACDGLRVSEYAAAAEAQAREAAERARATEAEARAERLAERLRTLGIEPD